MEESKLVADKTWSTFDLIVRVKIDGWKALTSCVTDSLRFACAFTSVAGRFGNGGQTDYAAANSILGAEMARLTANSECRAVAIGWTGWRDVGMATRGSIEAVFESAGIETWLSQMVLRYLLAKHSLVERGGSSAVALSD